MNIYCLFVRIVHIPFTIWMGLVVIDASRPSKRLGSTERDNFVVVHPATRNTIVMTVILLAKYLNTHIALATSTTGGPFLMRIDGELGKRSYWVEDGRLDDGATPGNWGDHLSVGVSQKHQTQFLSELIVRNRSPG